MIPPITLTGATDAAQIKTFDEHVHAGFDWTFTHDALSRLTNSDRGTLSGGNTFTNDWTLDQVGNWATYKQDVNGDSTYTVGTDIDESRTHNVVNELTARNTNIGGGADYNTMTYDAAGNLTDDIESYEYVYDAWNRLVEVENTSDSSTVSTFRYNGLGYRITMQYDADGDASIEAEEEYHFVYDTGRRAAMTRRHTDAAHRRHADLHGFLRPVSSKTT